MSQWSIRGGLRDADGGELQSPRQEVSVLVAGDLCVRERTEELVRTGKSSGMVSGIQAELQDKDLSIVNLEGPVAVSGEPIPKSGPAIRMIPAAMDVVLAAGFDVAGCANNHMGDWGPAAVVETIERLEGAGIRPAGVGANSQEAAAPVVVERKGLQIGILAFAENEFGLADRTTPGGNRLDPLSNIRDIRKTAEAVDVLIVLVHGGNEYNPIPSPRMRQTYRAFADAGADAVIAGHTHCPQGFEIFRGVPIVYSQGNFLFDQRPGAGPYRPPAWWTGYMARIRFTDSGARQLDIIPHSCFPEGRAVVPLEGDDLVEFLAYLDHLSTVLQDHDEAQRYWDAWCSREGQGYVKTLHGGIDHAEGDRQQILLGWRNLFACEAHNELLTRYLELASQGQLESARAYVPRLQLLMEGVIPG